MGKYNGIIIGIGCAVLTYVIYSGLLEWLSKDSSTKPTPTVSVTPTASSVVTPTASNTTSVSSVITSSPSDVSSSTPLVLSEVFGVKINNQYNTPYNKSEEVCKGFNSTLATKEQLEEAFSYGADWCSTGWIKDNDKEAFYPISNTYGQGCGAGSTGIKTFLPSNSLAGVNCYGVKPEKDTKDVLPFNNKEWNKPSTKRTDKEVYLVKKKNANYAIPNSESTTVCNKFGAEVATLKELEDAQVKEADWCSTGWVKDVSDKAYYPITTSIKIGCGTSAGVQTFLNGNANVNCYGVKPIRNDDAEYEVWPFNDKNWFQQKFD